MSFKIPEKDIEIRIQNLAEDIYHYYYEKQIKEIFFIFIGTSSFIFASDLIRALSFYEIKILSDLISIKSYIGKESKKVRINRKDLFDKDLNNKVVLIVDDILDTGQTLSYLHKKIMQIYNPSIIDYCCLMRKSGVVRNIDIEIKFIGFDIPNIFVVGYGLDYNGHFRELPYIKELLLS